MPDRDTVLSALPDSGLGEPPVYHANVDSLPIGELWAWFVRMLSAVGGELKSIEDLAEFRGSAYCDLDVPAPIIGGLGSIEDVWAAELGVSLCDLAVAETGSLLIAASAGRNRLTSLVPPIHAVLIDASQVVASLEEALAAASNQTCWLVTGPSRTADIEGVLVNGVHGPKRLWVVPIPENLPG